MENTIEIFCLEYNEQKYRSVDAGTGKVRKGKEEKFRQQSHGNTEVTLDPSNSPLSVEVRLLWEGATWTLDNYTGCVMSGPDALGHWPVIDELGQKAYGTQWERKRRKKMVRLVFWVFQFVTGQSTEILACLYVPLQHGQSKLRFALEWPAGLEWRNSCCYFFVKSPFGSFQ